MKERGILFNTEMVKAVLDGRKTQTRRVVKPQPYKHKFGSIGMSVWRWLYKNKYDFQDQQNWINHCPYGQVGDRLWVRETTCIAPKNFASPDDSCIPDKEGELRYVSYRADGHPEDAMRDYKLKWTPSIHVPRWASRINLEITDIRVERVQDITEEDSLKEGIKIDGTSSMGHVFTGKEHFWGLWDFINKKRGFGWDVNPWVWVVEFKVI